MAEKKYQMSTRFKVILNALKEFKKGATTKAIAKKVKLTTAGTSASLKALQSHGYVKRLEGEKGDAQWIAIKG